MKRRLTGAALALLLSGAQAWATGLEGIWKTEPDRKDLTSHIQISPCGSGFCGTILSAFDPSGAQVQTKNIGKRLFWDLKDQGDGSYGGGTAYVPLIERETKNFTLTLNGNALRVQGRIGPVRSTSNWTRLK